MLKNTAGQGVSFQATNVTTGLPVTTGTPVVYYTIGTASQVTGTGTATHEGNGEWRYALPTAETNGDDIAYTFTLTNSVNHTLNVYPIDPIPTLTNQNTMLSQLSGSTIAVNQNPSPGGKIEIKSNDDYTVASGNSISLAVTDVGAVLHTQMTAALVASISIGFRMVGPGGASGDITGTIAKANITEASDVTTIPIEITNTQTTGKTPGEYQWDIQLKLTSGKYVTVLSDDALVKADNAPAT
jgi:hypothetical protein